MTLTTGTYTDVMVDIETTGTNPDRHAILQIAAVRFNLRDGTIDHSMFNRCLEMPRWRSWDEGTRQWWGNQPREVLDDILSRAEPYQDVMQAFWQWANATPGLRLWAKPTSFDPPFIASYFDDCGLLNPFHYRIARDLNSWVEARYYPESVPDLGRGDYGAAHNALNDCLYQIEYLFKHYDSTKAA